MKRLKLSKPHQKQLQPNLKTVPQEPIKLQMPQPKMYKKPAAVTDNRSKLSLKGFSLKEKHDPAPEVEPDTANQIG